MVKKYVSKSYNNVSWIWNFHLRIYFIKLYQFTQLYNLFISIIIIFYERKLVNLIFNTYILFFKSRDLPESEKKSREIKILKTSGIPEIIPSMHLSMHALFFVNIVMYELCSITDKRWQNRVCVTQSSQTTGHISCPLLGFCDIIISRLQRVQKCE